LVEIRGHLQSAGHGCLRSLSRLSVWVWPWLEGLFWLPGLPFLSRRGWWPRPQPWAWLCEIKTRFAGSTLLASTRGNDMENSI